MSHFTLCIDAYLEKGNEGSTESTKVIGVVLLEEEHPGNRERIEEDKHQHYHQDEGLGRVGYCPEDDIQSINPSHKPQDSEDTSDSKESLEMKRRGEGEEGEEKRHGLR